MELGCHRHVYLNLPTPGFIDNYVRSLQSDALQYNLYSVQNMYGVQQKQNLLCVAYSLTRIFTVVFLCLNYDVYFV